MGDKQGMSFTPRSGDTHVIGEDGGAVNIDAQARMDRLAGIVAPLTDESGAHVTPPAGNVTDPPQPLRPVAAPAARAKK